MFLIKCPCQCWFTLTDETAAKVRSFNCPNCAEPLNFKSAYPQGFAFDPSTKFETYKLPDDVEIKFDFKMSQ